MSDPAEIVFLSMYWGGGGPYEISDILHVCDWINRMFPDKEEMENALNYLLALGLVEARGEEFSIPESRYHEFAAFRKKKRKDRFETVQLFFRGLLKIGRVPSVVKLSQPEYDRHLKKYRDSIPKKYLRPRRGVRD